MLIKLYFSFNIFCALIIFEALSVTTFTSREVLIWRAHNILIIESDIISSVWLLLIAFPAIYNFLLVKLSQILKKRDVIRIVTTIKLD